MMKSRNFLWLGASALLALGFQTSVSAQSASVQSADYFWSGGRKIPLRASSWVGVQVVPNTSGVVLNGLKSESALDISRNSLRFGAKNIAVLPLKSGASPAQKQALTTRLKVSSSVREIVKTYSVNGDGNALPYVATGEIAVSFRASTSSAKVQSMLKKYGAQIVRSLGPIAPNAVLLRLAKSDSIVVANALYESGLTNFSHPHFLVPMQKRDRIGAATRRVARSLAQSGRAQSGGFAPSATANDPLYPNQWHLNNTGQGGGTAGADVRIEDAWNLTKGSPNITVAIMDDGVDIAHEDFGSTKLVAGYDFLDNDSNPSPMVSDDDHGTACAGVAVAKGDNGIGVAGAAPGSKLMPIRMLGDLTSEVGIADAFRFASQHGADIISNSWGPIIGGVELPDVVKAAIDYATTTGRGGKGCVVLFASGNENRDSDLDGYAAYERVINVAASTNQDLRASYSNTGRTVDVCAPSNGGSLGITTTDRMGAVGYSAGNYTNSFGGTSSATPLVAGVVALLLSVEPNLTYGQVRQRLQETADKIDPAGGAYNASGQSIYYGYGRVNASRALLGRPPIVALTTPLDNATVSGAAVALKATTTNDARVQSVRFDARPINARGSKSNLNLSIPDANATGVTSELVLSGTPRRLSAQAIVSLQISHSYVGDLQIVLISPNGTREIVYDHAGGAASNLALNAVLPFASRDTTGTYKLQVIDDVEVDSGTLVSWGLTLVGNYTSIATQSAASHTLNTPWSATWNTGNLASGEYEVRATATTAQQGTFSDSNLGIRVVGADATRFAVGGKVLDTAGRAIANALVTLGALGSQSVTQSTRTNAQGLYRFAATAGQYEVRASLSGAVIEPALRRVGVVNAAVENVNFTLTLRDSVAPTLRIATPIATPTPVITALNAVMGTAQDNSGGSGIARVTGTLYRYATSARGAGYYTSNNAFETNPTAALRERLVAMTIASNGVASYTFGLPSLDEGRYRVIMQCYDRANNRSLPQAVEWVIDRSAPTLRLARPLENSEYEIGILTLADGTVVDIGGVASLKAQFYRYASGSTPAGYWSGAGNVYSTVLREIVLPTTSVFRFNFPANLGAGRYLVRFVALDKAGNRAQVQAAFTLKSSTLGSIATRVVPGTRASWATATSEQVLLIFANHLPNVPAEFEVSLNGVAIEAESVGVLDNRLTIGLPLGVAQSGDTIVVRWPDLRDGARRKIAAGSHSVVVR